ncbi:hypothetical protein LO762_30755 [Actinocorallia sp. API 0066]|uniref:hypothetical protein n=1 Tax=Actinocorallia sp. API 0066 TaxID=2896846 RepID=UPI001E513A43|nr:hypothetical protein [Actinocorallia sp. API 0066]MCD0453533.1 hypothetical protein [Actinocorallia sp. API 0066]
MGRVMCCAVCVAVAASVVGCGTREAAPAPPPQGPEAALLTAAEAPHGFLPAEPQEVFRGVVPFDRDCADLFALADGRGQRISAPRAQTAFYRAEPSATLSQRVLRLGEADARKAVADARRFIAGCQVVEAAAGQGVLRLGRAHARQPRLAAADTAAVAYRQETPEGMRISYEVVVHRVGGDLLLVAGPALLRPGQEGPAATAAEAAAVRLERAAKVSP